MCDTHSFGSVDQDPEVKNEGKSRVYQRIYYLIFRRKLYFSNPDLTFTSAPPGTAGLCIRVAEQVLNLGEHRVHRLTLQLTPMFQLLFGKSPR